MIGFFFIVLACFCWAIDTLIRYPLTEGVDPIKIVFYEHLFLTIAVFPFILKSWRKIFQLTLGDFICFVIVGVFGSAMGNIFITKAFAVADSNPSAVLLLQKFQVIFAVLTGRIFLGERLKKGFFFWGFLAVIGATLISFPDMAPLFKQRSFSYDQIESSFYALIAAASWGTATGFGKKLSIRGHNEIEIMFGRFLWGLIATIPFIIALPQGFLPLLAVKTYLNIALMIFIAGILGVYFYYRGLKYLTVRVGAIAELFFPFFAVGASWIFLGKELISIQILGGLILILSSFVIQWKKY